MDLFRRGPGGICFPTITRRTTGARLRVIAPIQMTLSAGIGCLPLQPSECTPSQTSHPRNAERKGNCLSFLLPRWQDSHGSLPVLTLVASRSWERQTCLGEGGGLSHLVSAPGLGSELVANEGLFGTSLS